MPTIATMTVSGVTPAILGEEGLAFDSVLTAIPVSDPVTITAVGAEGISGQVSINAANLIADDTDLANFIQAFQFENAEGWDTRLAAALKSAIQSMKIVNGYNEDVATVRDDMVTMAEIQDFYGIAILWGKAEAQEAGNDTTFAKIPALIVAFFREQNDAMLRRRNITKDIKRAIEKNWMLPHPADGIPTCQDAEWKHTKPFGSFNQKPKAGVQIGYEFHVHYRTNDETIT